MITPDTIIPCMEKSENGHKVVAVIGWARDFAAYEGLDNMSIYSIASNGDKISEREARSLFPELSSYKYRP